MHIAISSAGHSSTRQLYTATRPPAAAMRSASDENISGRLLPSSHAAACGRHEEISNENFNAGASCTPTRFTRQLSAATRPPAAAMRSVSDEKQRKNTEARQRKRAGIRERAKTGTPPWASARPVLIMNKAALNEIAAMRILNESTRKGCT